MVIKQMEIKKEERVKDNLRLYTLRECLGGHLQ